MTITTTGLDLAKRVFQAHGVDETGATALTKRLHRKQVALFFSKLPPYLIAMEACGTAHYWARTLAAMGHEVRLIPPSYVKAYVKRGNAAAICEAVQRPTMRFVPVKTIEQQRALMAHRARSLLVRQRTMLPNAVASAPGGLALVANPGIANPREAGSASAIGREWLAIVRAHHAGSPSPADHDAFRGDHGARSQAPRAACRKWGRSKAHGDPRPRHRHGSGNSRHRHRSPPVPVGRTICRLARPDAATASTGGKTHLGGISKRGDRYLRRLLVVGPTAVIRHTKDKPTPMANRIRKLLVQKSFRVVSVALANKLARIAWAS